MRSWHGNLSPFGLWHTAGTLDLAEATRRLLFSNNEPGFLTTFTNVADYDWRRNLLTRTEEFDNAAWLKTRSSISANVAVAPDGNITADKLIEDTSSLDHRLNYFPSLTLSTVSASTVSIYMKADGRNFFRFFVLHIPSFPSWTVDLTTGAVSFQSGSSLVTVSTTDVGNGWWRIAWTFTAQTAASGGAIYGSLASDAAGTINYTGDGTSGILVWGAQVELGSTATDYQRIRTPEIELAARFPNTTVYADTAGTTPAIVGGTVGLALDRSQGLTLGPQLVTNGTFDADSDWVKSANWSINGGVATLSGASGANDEIYQDVTGLTAGKTYVATVEVTSAFELGSSPFQVRNANNDASLAQIDLVGRGTGTVSLTFNATTATHRVRIFSNTTTVAGTIDNISVRELPGNHWTQPTSASRPILGRKPVGGRRNLLLRTEEFDNSYWATRRVTKSANVAVAPNGTTTADAVTETAENNTHQIFNDDSATQRFPVSSGLSYTFSIFLKKGDGSTAPDWLLLNFIEGFATNGVAFNLATGAVGSATGATGNIIDEGAGWYRCIITATASASTNLGRVSISFTNNTNTTTTPSYAGATTSNVFIWGAQVEASATATPYQRVTTQFDITEAGKANRHYLYGGGAADPRWMITPTITPGTDKVQVFAGVRKLSDAASGLLVELSTTTLSNNGSFHLVAPSAAGTYGWFSRGTTRFEAQTPTTFNAPITNIVTGIGDISGDNATIRVNGVQSGQNTGDQGTGNYLAYPAYIGARGGSSLFFNGEIYSLITRFGPNLTTTEIERVEAYVASQVAEETI